MIESKFWLKRVGFEVYVRKSRPLLEGKRRTMLAIVNIEIPEKPINRGWFRYFRKISENMNPWEEIAYENFLYDYI